MNRFLPRALMAPAVISLFLWMIVPLVMTIYFSVIRFNLMSPEKTGFIGLENFEYFVTDPSFGTAVMNTLLLLGSVILITVVLGTLLALLIDAPVSGPRPGAYPADFPVLCHAHGECAAVEAHDDEPHLRRAGPGLALLWRHAGGLADRLSRCSASSSSWPGNGCHLPR